MSGAMESWAMTLWIYFLRLSVLILISGNLSIKYTVANDQSVRISWLSVLNSLMRTNFRQLQRNPSMSHPLFSWRGMRNGSGDVTSDRLYIPIIASTNSVRPFILIFLNSVFLFFCVCVVLKDLWSLWQGTLINSYQVIKLPRKEAQTSVQSMLIHRKLNFTII